MDAAPPRGSNGVQEVAPKAHRADLNAAAVLDLVCILTHLKVVRYFPAASGLCAVAVAVAVTTLEAPVKKARPVSLDGATWKVRAPCKLQAEILEGADVGRDLAVLCVVALEQDTLKHININHHVVEDNDVPLEPSTGDVLGASPCNLDLLLHARARVVLLQMCHHDKAADQPPDMATRIDYIDISSLLRLAHLVEPEIILFGWLLVSSIDPYPLSGYRALQVLRICGAFLSPECAVWSGVVDSLDTKHY